MEKRKAHRQWIKWHQSGAVPKPTFPEGALVIDGIGTHYLGPASGYDTLSLGRDRRPFGWIPLICVVVPTDEKREIGQILKKVPGNSVPVELFFKKIM